MKDVIITLGLLCYNTKEESLRCLKALVEEAERIKPLVGALFLAIHDNGTDGTAEACVEYLGESTPWVVTSERDVNVGQGAGRNAIVKAALGLSSDYILFLDGDIRVVPGSLEFMIRHLINNQSVGCVSPHPVRQTRNEVAATKQMTHIEMILNDITSACTGYALYRADVFRRGCRFEDTGPFYGPGWGLEDDDIYLQMTMAGWKVDYFVGIVYLQRKARSSWEFIKKEGYDVLKVWDARKAYFLEKWKTKGVKPSILLAVQAQSLKGLRG